MAEGFERYHVPQQSRREKLRVVVQNHPRCAEHLQECVGLLPLYDPSLLPSDLLTCANLHQPNDALGETDTRKSNPISACGGVKEEGVNLMGYVGGVINASSSSTSHHLYMDPQSSIPINPSSIQDMSTNPFLCAPQNLRLFDQSFNSGEVVVFKPEPLSITHHANNAGGQGLSLSLSSLHTQQTKLPLELNLQRYESSIFNEKITEDDGGYLVPGIVDGGLTSNDTSRSSVPLGPFTGYASILKGSRFLKPAQQLLEELCDVGSGIKFASDSTLIDSSSMESLSETVTSDDSLRCGDGNEHRTNKSKLISMLDEVYRRYKHYCQQVQAVLASFESVSGLGNAAPFANLALKAMFKHFRCLKNAITDQLQFTSKAHSPMDFGKDGTPRFGNSDRGIYSTRLVHNSGQPVWRPQRGLPERAVTVLRAWLFEHFLHPYPTDTDKLMLAKQTGLSRSQVSNWFINARVRVWKPMVEEIHVLETKQSQKTPQREEHIDRPGNHLPTANSLGSENPSTSIRRAQNLSFKNTRNELSDVTLGNDESMHLSHDNLSHYPQVNVGVNGAGGSGGVSLTLGLHQNNWIGLSEPLPIHAARHFGLDTNNERYVLGSFGAQNRQFGGSIIEGQHLHDFVG